MSYAPILTLANFNWLLVAMAFVIAPHAARLPIWVTSVCLVAGGWRWWIARHGARTPPWWAMALFAIGVTAGARLEYGRLFGREVGVMLLIVMLCLKILEMKTRRDALIAIFMGFFLAMTNFFYSQTLLMGAYMVGCVVIFVATLIGYHRVGTEPTWSERLRPAAMLTLQAVPLMLVLFFLFPRLSGPLWRMPGEESASTGLSDQMTPGDISKLSKSSSIAFRVDFDGAVPNNEDLYWRGPVLTQNLGRSWRASPLQLPVERSQLDITPTSRPVSYRVTLQPHNKPWLFALDMPVAAPPDAFFLPDFQLRSRTLVTSLRSYSLSSTLQFRAGQTLSDAERNRNLAVARGVNPRAVAYARDLKAKYPDPKQLIDQLMRRFNLEFEYTLEPPLLGANPVDEFLFDTKKGFCEHYASSFVFLLRAAGIPARVVTGYQGGEVNPITRQLVVRQSEAHSWAEVWFDDLGWVRADPTFAVSPIRINRGISEALGPIDVFDTVAGYDRLGVLRQLAFSWDAINNQWNQWVVGFNQDRQRFALSTWFGIDEADWRDLAKALLIGVLVTGALAAIWVIGRAYRARRPPLERAWRSLQEKMAKVGVPRERHEPPLAYMRRVAQDRPELDRALAPLIEAYSDLKYAPPAMQRITLTEFAASVRAFRPDLDARRT